jgi:hypothetical protein
MNERFLNILTCLLNPWSTVRLEKLTRSAGSQEIPRILWNSKVHYRFHKCPTPLPILSQLHPVSIPSHFLKILFPSGFPTGTLCTPLSSTCPAHFILHSIIEKQRRNSRTQRMFNVTGAEILNLGKYQQ